MALGVKTTDIITGVGMTLNIGNGSQGGPDTERWNHQRHHTGIGGGEPSIYTSAAHGTINSNLTGTGSYNKFGIGHAYFDR